MSVSTRAPQKPQGPSRRKLIALASAFAAILLSLGRGPAGTKNLSRSLQKSIVANSSIAGESLQPHERDGLFRPYSMVLEEIKEENDWKNNLVLCFVMPSSWRESLPRIVASWLRNYIATMGIYFGLGGVWSYYIYLVFGNYFFKSDEIPDFGPVSDQMKVAVCSIPLYAILPALTEWVVENGYTLAYSRISDVGVPRYLAFFALYMISVEFCVYWQHRNLHDFKIGYRVLHHIHHKYNKEGTMSPFAGLAFHPMDGILQALPYCWTLFYVPMHFLTHELLLFATGVWTANIHDNIHGDCAPIMGAKFHTIHHTAYNYNYGHYTIFMDKWFGTLLDPEDYPAWVADRSSKTKKEKALISNSEKEIPSNILEVKASAVSL